MSQRELYDNAKQYLSQKEQDVIDELVDSVEFLQVGFKTTICMMRCNNGCEIIGHSHVIDPEKYDIEIGSRYALDRAVEKLVEIWAYNQH